MKFLAAALALMCCACASLPETLTVRAEQSQYSPALSSTPGIRLRPIFVPPSGVNVEYHWSADFGSFVSWNPPAYKVKPLGSDFVATEGALYWTYDPALASARKPVVTVVIEARDADTGKVLSRAKLKLDWDGDTARVRD
ncbi:MAG TPA: hypothetical protein VH309_00385 [Elusimicrobiota bacterium]|jgi:hypothetical protein|nr:hypothetical protein [Elusimicrobiota bacterium]